MIRITRNNCVLLLCMLFCSGLHAQFKNKAALTPVAQTGFYSINITPELSSYVKTDFSDLRILDDKDKQVPYIINSIVPQVNINSNVYQPLTIIKNEQGDSGKTNLVIENRNKDNIGNIVLLVRNASVSRMADFSGSDNGKRWYSIIENINLQKTYTADSSSYLAEIIFPFNNYRFFKLVIHNGRNDPLNIIAAKSAKAPTAPVVDIGDIKRYEVNPACTFVQTDSSDGYSYLRVHNTRPYHVNRIALHVIAPRFFKRDVDVIVPYQPVANFTVTSDTLFNFYLPAFNNSDWTIKIFNGDNPPLLIKSVTTQQEAKAVIPYLESGKSYHLTMNDINAAAPHYDLQNFKDSIPAQLQPVSFSAIESIALKAAGTNKSIFTKAWIWAVIVVILVGLLYFTTRLTKEIAEKKP